MILNFCLRISCIIKRLNIFPIFASYAQHVPFLLKERKIILIEFLRALCIFKEMLDFIYLLCFVVLSLHCCTLQGLSLVIVRRVIHCGAQAFRCGCRSTDSRRVGLSSCSTGTQYLWPAGSRVH